jgi:hypothetical protein
MTHLLDEICDTVNGEVSVSYINPFNVQWQTIKLTSLFRNLVPSLLCIRILSIRFFSKFPKNWWFTKIKETPLFRSVEYNICSGNDSFEKVNRWCLNNIIMIVKTCKRTWQSQEKRHTNNTEQLKTDPQRKLKY